jgi:BASS family bile acid:Na+ symporter
VIPFTDFLEGDRAFSLLATMGAYLGALFIMPVMAAAHGEAEFISPAALLKVVLLLIVLPVAAAQALRLTGLHRRIEPVKGAITNWCFSLVTYTIVGLNSELLRQAPGALFPVMAAAFFSTFGLGVAITLTGRILRVQRQRLQSVVLLGTLKNYGLAGGLALALFSQKNGDSGGGFHHFHGHLHNLVGLFEKVAERLPAGRGKTAGAEAIKLARDLGYG